MRTRNQSKLQQQQQEDDNTPDTPSPHSHAEPSLQSISNQAVGRLLTRVNSRRKQTKYSKEELPVENVKGNEEHICDLTMEGSKAPNAENNTENKGGGVEGASHCDANEMDWEEGIVSLPESRMGNSRDLGREVTVEFAESPSAAQRKPARRASAEDKELSELVHKVNLLCLLARGRLVDNACNDPLIQASLLSLLPSHLLKLMEAPCLSANMLGSLVNWFYNVFHVRSQRIDKGSFKSNLACALETREGTAEEVAALSVALFRALNLTTRFISILDVPSLKPDADMAGSSNQDAPRLDTRINSSTTTVSSPSWVHATCPVHSSDTKEEELGQESAQRGKLYKKEKKSTCKKKLLKDIAVSNQADDGTSYTTKTKACSDNLDSYATKSAEGLKRKGDLEFEFQLEMALSATAAGARESKLCFESDQVDNSSSSPDPPLKKLRKTKIADSSVPKSHSSSAVWSRKNGPPLYWAEVYCNGETPTGRWVHIDAANGIVNGEDKVEGAAAAWRKPLKYVVAFAGNGAKDVTRRYCMQWYKVASRRINSQWWDMVLAPLKELELGATAGTVDMEAFQEKTSSGMEKKSSDNALEMQTINPVKTCCSEECPDGVKSGSDLGREVSKQDDKAKDLESPTQFPIVCSRNSLEDMELETKALTEPLPTNQLAYKNHHLYAIEKWLTKYQTLHPKGPLLGYCSGHPVYPRSCVQTLQTKLKWYREGFQVKETEVPAKVVKRSKMYGNAQISDCNNSEEDDGGTTIELFGEWQLELLQLPHAVNGIVPKNERGQVDAWSEKCLPPGTVHLRLPRLASVARRLDIDFAPAMVGFEFRNGRSFPVFEGIVVCTEFRDAILEAYGEEEERRKAEERKQNEAQALSRWFQLLSSIVTRQRLENSYVDSSSMNAAQDPPNSLKSDVFVAPSNSLKDGNLSREQVPSSVQDFRSPLPFANDHEHVFPIENQSFDEDSMIRTKRCPCGFSIELEEL